MVDDSTVALTAAISFFIVPSLSKNHFSKNKEKNGSDNVYKNKALKGRTLFGFRLLDWKAAVTIPWGTLLLIGGGLALAQGFTETGLDSYIADNLSFLNGMHFILLILILLIVTVFAGEVISNTATAALLLPILDISATTLSINPILLMAPIAVATSIGFIMPVATPQMQQCFRADM